MKKLTCFLLALILCLTGVFSQELYVNAEEVITEDVELSEIMTEDALIGYSENQTWGVYLMSGSSIINEAASNKIGWGGITYAKKTCQVSVNAIVERYESGSWVRVTSASNTVASGSTAVVSKTSIVGTGYYYRCRCYHYAHSDYSGSCTSALYM